HGARRRDTMTKKGEIGRDGRDVHFIKRRALRKDTTRTGPGQKNRHNRCKWTIRKGLHNRIAPKGNTQEETPMNTYTPHALSLIITFLVLTPAAKGQDPSKPTKGTVRAADGLNLVYELRGKGDTALIF